MANHRPTVPAPLPTLATGAVGLPPRAAVIAPASPYGPSTPAMSPKAVKKPGAAIYPDAGFVQDRHLPTDLKTYTPSAAHYRRVARPGRTKKAGLTCLVTGFSRGAVSHTKKAGLMYRITGFRRGVVPPGHTGKADTYLITGCHQAAVLPGRAMKADPCPTARP